MGYVFELARKLARLIDIFLDRENFNIIIQNRQDQNQKRVFRQGRPPQNNQM